MEIEPDDIQRLLQWFHAVEDLNPAYLEPGDHLLAQRLGEPERKGAVTAQQSTALDPGIWQEYDCPDSGVDFDIDEAGLVAVGEQFYCPGCGKHHTATIDFPENTYVRLFHGGALECRRTPKDAAEKDAWRAEVAVALTAMRSTR